MSSRLPHVTLSVRGLLLVVWFVAFFFCMGVPLLYARAIPLALKDVLLQTSEVFTPQLATMLAFVFSNRRSSPVRASERWKAVVAFVVSIAYCAPFIGMTVAFSMGHLKTIDLLRIYGEVRPLSLFLVTGVIAYYFGSRSES